MKFAIRGLVGLAAVSCVTFVAAAQAQAQTQELTATGRAALNECIRLKSTGQDRLLLARWIIAALGSGPQVKDLTVVDSAKKAGLDQAVARTFTRLLAVDCAAEAKPLFMARDSAAISAAGETLGQLAVQELMANKDAAAAVGAFAQYIREEDFADLRK
jgi:hypothetical protein